MNVKEGEAPVLESRSRIWTVRICFFILVVSGSFIFYYIFDRNKDVSVSREEDSEHLDMLEVGSRYRIFVKSLIVPVTDPDGDFWDVGGKDSAPDLFYRIIYHQNMVYESSTIPDVLVAEFSPFKAGITDLLVSKNAASYLEAANVAYEKEGTYFLLEVFDEDVFNDDSIGVVQVDLRDLKLGMNRLSSGELIIHMAVVDADADLNRSLKDLNLIQ